MGRDSRAQRKRNRTQIRAIACAARSDLDALARLFEDESIADDGTVHGRLRALLDATERGLIPGLQTAIPFSDTGFDGDQLPDGSGFRDPWPSSRNQVGHFLTAVGLRVASEVVSRPIPLLGSIRAIVAAPKEMSDVEVALRLSIGHEKATDPRTAHQATVRALTTGLKAWACVAALGASQKAQMRVFVLATLAQAARQAQLILAAFRTQFAATTEADLAAWSEALRMSGSAAAFSRDAVEGPRTPLRAICVAHGEGNSVQDLRLTLAGWRLGELIESGAFQTGKEIGAWLRRALSAPDYAAPPAHRTAAGPAARAARRPGTLGLAYGIADSRMMRSAVGAANRVLPAPRVQLTTYEIALPRLPRHLDGLRVLHLSDLHVHPGSDLAWQVPALVADVHYDLLCYTGDFIDIDDDIPEVERLLARMPGRESYAVLGNHDYIPFGRSQAQGANDSARLRQVLDAAGITVLANESRSVCGGALHLAGIDDPATGRDNLHRAYAGVPASSCTLLLAHSPDIVLRLDSHCPDLVISGHTHGGQVRVPIIGAVVTMSRLPRQLVSGLGEYEGVTLFVSRGIGYSGLNIRLGSPPEAALLTLRAASR